MGETSRSEALELIQKSVHYYFIGPNQGISAQELVNDIFSLLGEEQLFDLVDDVMTLIPDTALPVLQGLVEKILQPGSNYVPFMLGTGPSEEWREARRQRLRPACRQLAVLFEQHLKGRQTDSERGST